MAQIDGNSSSTDVLIAGTAVVAVAISIIVYLHQRKELRLSALLKTLEFLSAPDQRESRAIIFDVYWHQYPDGLDAAKAQGIKGKMIFDENVPIKTHIKKVTSAFDQAGVLVKNGMIKQELFFDLYSDMVVRVWKILEEDILIERKRNEEVCKWFKELKKDADRYRQRKGLEEPKVYKRASMLSVEEIKNLIQIQS